MTLRSSQSRPRMASSERLDSSMWSIEAATRAASSSAISISCTPTSAGAFHEKQSSPSGRSSHRSGTQMFVVRHFRSEYAQSRPWDRA